MIYIFLVDDEKPALHELESSLPGEKDFNITGMFSNPVEAPATAGMQQPEMAFLDIQMPVVNGVQAAFRVLESSPKTFIVFVTAYDNYAVDAFELHALDYLLKPIKPIRLAKTLQRIRQVKPT